MKLNLSTPLEKNVDIFFMNTVTLPHPLRAGKIFCVRHPNARKSGAGSGKNPLLQILLVQELNF